MVANGDLSSEPESVIQMHTLTVTVALPDFPSVSPITFDLVVTIECPSTPAYILTGNGDSTQAAGEAYFFDTD